jgi:hypothetical protein
LLSAIETCEEYKNILLCYLIIVFTDHKNKIINGLKASDRVLRWLFIILEIGVTFEYLSEKKQKNVVADSLSCLDIDSLKIQEEEVLTLLSESENNSISNIKYTIPMHTALIFKEQAKAKDTGLRQKGFAQRYYLLCYKEKIYIPQSLRQMTKSTVLVP